jgi:penicillin-binding protein 1A
LRDGAKPDDYIDDEPTTIAGWSPTNADGIYRGPMPLREAFAISSNVAAARLAQTVGIDKVIAMARNLGVTSPLPNTPSLALGTATMTLLELTSAYAAVANGAYPVLPHGIPTAAPSTHPLDRDREWQPMLDMLWEAANEGTGRLAALSQPTFGKTGTTQDNRDALFVGFAGDLVVGVWVGRDDNKPVPGLSGGKLPALIWRDFMGGAPLRPVARVYRAPVRERPQQDVYEDEDRSADSRYDPRYDPREDPRYDPREDPRYDPRDDPRYDPRDDQADDDW